MFAVSVLDWLSLLGLAGYAEVLEAHGFDQLDYMVSDTVRLYVCLCVRLCVLHKARMYV